MDIREIAIFSTNLPILLSGNHFQSFKSKQKSYFGNNTKSRSCKHILKNEKLPFTLYNTLNKILTLVINTKLRKIL